MTSNNKIVFGIFVLAFLVMSVVPVCGQSVTPKGSLVIYYPFDGDTRDYSGNGNDGSNYGAAFVSGISGQALSFDGMGDYVSAMVDINPDVMPQMTMTAWVRADDDSGTIISHDNGGYDRTIDIDTRGGGFGWSAFSGSGGVWGYHPVTIGEWVFIAAVYDQDAGIVKLYVNDIYMYQEKGELGSGWDKFHIGSNPTFGAHFSGTIDEVKIYNYVLSADEIKSLYEKEGSLPSTTTPTTTHSLTPDGGLVAHYPFDGDYKDYSGNGNGGIPKGSMAFADAELGKGASFDGKSWIEVSDSDSLDLSTAFTFSVWLYKQDAGTGGWGVVFSKGDTSALDSKSPYALLHSYDGKSPSIGLVKNNYRGIIGSTAKTDFGEWYFLTVTGDGADIKYYINGELKDTKEWVGTLPNSDSKLLIGSDPPGVTEYFKGVMDDLRIYDHALSAAEIKALYEGEGSPAPSPTPAISSGKGDCDGDGEITSLDALCALQMAVGKRAEDLVMDVNGDGRVTSLDARKILRIAAGLEVLP